MVYTLYVASYKSNMYAHGILNFKQQTIMDINI